MPDTAPTPAPFALRPHAPGDLGWLIGRHGAVYAQSFGWTIAFEALVARIAADFIERFDPTLEGCWIAERATSAGPQRLGAVCLVQARDDTTQAIEPGVGQLRLLLVEPAARGLGVGSALVAECQRFARQAGYRQMRLWTQSCLLDARRIYARAGWHLVDTEPHHSFGQDLLGERWELTP